MSLSLLCAPAPLAVRGKVGLQGETGQGSLCTIACECVCAQGATSKGQRGQLGQPAVPVCEALRPRRVKSEAVCTGGMCTRGRCVCRERVR